MAAVDPLIVKLIADNRDFIDSMNKSQRVADAKLDQIEKRSVKMGQGVSNGFKLAKAAAIGFVASIGVDTIVQAIKSGLDYAASLGEVAQQLGVTTDALQEYRYAGSQAGLATEEIDMALGQLTRRIGEGVNGTKAQADAFEKLGISLKDAKGNVIATGDAIPLIADALQKIKSPAEQSAILLDLFGKSGAKLLPLLSEGSKGVNGLRDAAQRLGIVLSSEQIAKADETADKLDALKQVLAAKIAGTVADNSNSILALANALGDLVNQIGPALAKYKEFVNFISKNSAQIERGAGRLTTAFGIATGNQAFIQNGMAQTGRASSVLAPFNSKKRGGFIAGQSKFSGGGLDQILGREGLGASGAGTGVDIKNLQGLLVAELLGPTKAQAKAISAATVEIQRQNADLAIALADLSGSVSERAAAEKLRIDADAAAERERLNADKEMSKATRAELLAINEKKASAQRQLVDQRAQEEAAASAREATEKLARAREENVDLELAALDAEAGVTRDIKARAAIEARILALQQQEERARLEAAISAGEIADATKARADLARKQAADSASQQLGNLSPGATYLDDLRTKAINANVELEALAVGGLRDLSNGIGDAIANGGDLGDVLEDSFKRIIAQVIALGFELLVIKPLLESLGGGLGGAGGGGGIGGFLGSLFGSVAGRASGGPVNAGQVYRVNEGVGKEFFRPNTGGDIIPLSKMNAAQPGGGQPAQAVTLRVELSGDIDARIDARSAGVAVEVVRAAEPSLTNKAVNETFRRGQRPSLGR